VLPFTKWQFINPVSIFKILHQIKKLRPQILLLEHPYHGIAGILAQKFYKVKLVLHQHNIEYKRFKDLGKWWWPILYQFEKWVSTAADLVLFKTGEDQEDAISSFKLSKDKCRLLPYGIKEKQFKAAKEKQFFDQIQVPYNNKIILFAGTLDYQPNADAVEGIFKKLAPLLQEVSCTILICGRNQLPQFAYLNNLSHPKVIMVGAVEDIGQYFYNADVFINPVLSGGGIQTKILEALSYHCPVVTFKKGLTGIDATLTEKLYSVEDDDWHGMAKAIKNALRINKQPVEPTFFSMYSWENILPPVVSNMKRIVLQG
jgi:glycosyltransferase involved in cell wall biosynthesis